MTQLSNDEISRNGISAIRGFIRTSPYTGYWLPGWGADGFSLWRWIRAHTALILWAAWWLALAGAVGLALLKGML